MLLLRKKLDSKMKKKGNLEFAAETSLAFSRYIFFLYVREESTNIYLRNIQPFCHRVHIFVFPFVVSNNLYR